MKSIHKDIIFAKHEQNIKHNFSLKKKKSSTSYVLKTTSILALSFSTLNFTSCHVLSETVRSSASFIDSIGVAAHLSYTNTSYGKYDTVIKPRLKELGIRHIRDGVTLRDKPTQDKFNDLAKIGIKSTLVMDPRDLSEVSEAVEIAKRVANSVEAIEGPNELDINQFTYKGESFPNGLRKFQNELFNAIKSDSATSRLPVLSPSIAGIDNIPTLGKVSCDINTIHYYHKNWRPGHPFLTDWVIPRVGLMCGSNAPTIVTETGYHNGFNFTNYSSDDPWPGYSEEITAKYIPRILLHNFNLGISRTFIYELIDEGPQHNNSDQHFGLLRYDGFRKPAFNSIKNLIYVLNSNLNPSRVLPKSKSKVKSGQVGKPKTQATLQDRQNPKKNSQANNFYTKKSKTTSSRKFTSNSLNFTLNGDLANVEQTILQKNTNVSFLILWQEVESYDGKNRRSISISDRPLKLSLGDSYKDISLYLPVSSVKPVTQYKQRKEIDINVPDQPLVIRLARR